MSRNGSIRQQLMRRMAPKVKTNGTTTGIGTGNLHRCPLKTGRLRRGRTVLIRTALDPTPKPRHRSDAYDETEGHYRKRPTADYSRPPHPKHPRIGQGDKAGTASVSATVVSGMGLPSSSAAPFDPASLVQSREGTFTPPDPIVKYLEKHFKHCQSRKGKPCSRNIHDRIQQYVWSLG